MSRITGTDAYDLMEAYNNVYAPQELTEEQVWEEVESWVNSLLEEGYDLSEYTWEEMYESYLNEMGQRMTTGQATAPKATPVSQPKPQVAGGGMGGRRGSGSSPSVRYSTPNPSFQQSGGFGRYAAPSAQVKTPAPAAATPKPAAATPKPAAAAPKPAAAGGAGKVAPTNPAAPAKPATGMLGKTSFERRTPTSAELKAAQAARASGASPEKALQAAKSVGGALSQATAAASKPAAFSPTSAAAKTTPTPVTPKAPTGGPRTRAQVLGQSFDPFDVVKGHLIDEGYADTEEAALKIMANMSEEWRQSIVEGEENKEDSQKPFTGEGPKKPKGWRPTGPKLKSGQRPGYAR
jgi:hypothetical protein